MGEKELSVCIGIHHIATLLGISEGIYYLFAGKQRFWRSCGVFLLTVFQSWAGLKILADLQKGKSRLNESYRNLEKIKAAGDRGGEFYGGWCCPPHCLSFCQYTYWGNDRGLISLIGAGDLTKYSYAYSLLSPHKLL